VAGGPPPDEDRSYRPSYCFWSLAGPLKQVSAIGTDGEASAPSEFKKAYANDESRRRLLWEQEVPSSSLGAPTRAISRAAMAIWARRGEELGALVHHSDRGGSSWRSATPSASPTPAR
jgi:hypothetical protein